MGRATHIQTSFNAGELSPQLEGRVDLQSYQRSAHELTNFVPTVEGPAEKRPGTRFVVPARFELESPDAPDFHQESRLIPFRFSREQSYVIEVAASDLYDDQPRSRIRFFRNGELVLNADQTITDIAVGSTTRFTMSANHHLEINDLVFITGVSGTLGPRVNNRQFQVLGVPNAPTATEFSIDFNSTGLTDTNAGTVNAVYELFGPWGAFEEINGVETDPDGVFFSGPMTLSALSFAQSADVLYIAHPHHIPYKLLRHGDNDWTLTPAVGTGDLGQAIELATFSGTTFTTSTSHGLVVGDKVLLTRVQGTRELNGGQFRVLTTPTSTSFTLSDAGGSVISDGGLHDFVDPFSAGLGFVQKYVSHHWPVFEPEPLNDDDLVVATGGFEKGDDVTLYFTRTLSNEDGLTSTVDTEPAAFLKLREVPEEQWPKWESVANMTDDKAGGVSVGEYAHWEGNVYELVDKNGQGQTGTSPPVHEREGERQLDHRWTWEFAHKGDGFAEITTASGNTVTGVVRRRLPESCFDANALISGSATSQAGTPVQITVASTANLVDGDRVLLFGFALDTNLNGKLVYVDVTSGTTFDAYLDRELTEPLPGAGGGTGGEVVNLRKATTRWAKSAWRRRSLSNEMFGPGGPSTVAFFEDRLVWAGSVSFPTTLWLSETAHYDSHDAHDAILGALNFTLNTQDMNAIEWVHSRRHLVVGTQGGEFVVNGQNPDEPISAENPVKPLLMTTHGVRENVRGVQRGNVLLFVQRAGQKILEFVYDTYNSDEYVAADVSLLSAHLFAGLIKQIELKQEPQPNLWAVMDDGSSAVCIYDRTQEVVGWAPVELGGSRTLDSTPDPQAIDETFPAIRSVAVIPHPDLDQDQVWMVVARTIGGFNRLYIETLEKPFPANGDLATEAWYLDSAISYSGVAESDFTGLDHLEGLTVSVFGDGQYVGDFTVEDGAVTIGGEVEEAVIGLPYTAVLETSRIEAGGSDGPAQGKFKNIRNAVLRLIQTGAGLFYGRDAEVMDRLPMTTDNDPAARRVTLINGDTRELELPGDVNDLGRVRIEHREPLPCTLSAIVFQTQVEDD